jgi:demethylmenaquinone methyltransferase/2-methoxy-6-polyprenyl-1,4-benzoquinol methylase
MLSGMPQTTWQAQVAYYRRRAAEYDLTSYGDVPRADRRIASVLGQLRPGGDVLEIACGTGIWTRQLTELGWHATVTRSDPDWLLGEARPALRP